MAAVTDAAMNIAPSLEQKAQIIENALDVARGLEIDPAEMRRRNYIAPDQFPYTIPSGNEYDSGNYEATLDKVLEINAVALNPQTVRPPEDR